MLNNDMEASAIASLFGVTPRAVRNWAKETKAEKERGRREQIVRLHGLGWSPERIGGAVGLDPEQVTAVLERSVGKVSDGSRPRIRRRSVKTERPRGEHYITDILDGLQWQVSTATAALQGVALWPGSRTVVQQTLDAVYEKLEVLTRAARSEGFTIKPIFEQRTDEVIGEVDYGQDDGIDPEDPQAPDGNEGN